MIPKLVIAGLACVFTSVVSAETVSYQTKVIQTAVIEEEKGGCIAKLADAPPEKGLWECTSPWIHFSCNGNYNSQAAGYSKLQAAQLSLITGNSVKITVDDNTSKRIKGKCFAPRIDNLPS